MPQSRARRILLVAYFYPALPRHRRAAAGRDGEVPAPRSATSHRADDRRRTAPATATTATGRRPHRRRSALARAPAGKEHVDALFDSDTYSGRPHPLSKVIVPEPLAVAWAPFARSRGAAPPPRDAVRLRDHDLAAGVRARRRAWRSAPRGALGRRRPRRLDLRAAAARVPDARRSALSTSGSSAAGSAAPTWSSACPSPPPTTCAARGSPTRS